MIEGKKWEVQTKEGFYRIGFELKNEFIIGHRRSPMEIGSIVYREIENVGKFLSFTTGECFFVYNISESLEIPITKLIFQEDMGNIRVHDLNPYSVWGFPKYDPKDEKNVPKRFENLEYCLGFDHGEITFYDRTRSSLVQYNRFEPKFCESPCTSMKWIHRNVFISAHDDGFIYWMNKKYIRQSKFNVDPPPDFSNEWGTISSSFDTLNNTAYGFENNIWSKEIMSKKNPFAITKVSDHRINEISLYKQTYLACACDGDELKVIAIPSLCLHTVFHSSKGCGGFKCCDWSPCGQFLIAATDEDTVNVYHFHSGLCLLTCVGHQGVIRSLKFEPHRSTFPSVVRFMSCSDDSLLGLWEFRINDHFFNAFDLVRKKNNWKGTSREKNKEHSDEEHDEDEFFDDSLAYSKTKGDGLRKILKSENYVEEEAESDPIFRRIHEEIEKEKIRFLNDNNINTKKKVEKVLVDEEKKERNSFDNETDSVFEEETVEGEIGEEDPSSYSYDESPDYHKYNTPDEKMFLLQPKALIKASNGVGIKGAAVFRDGFFVVSGNRDVKLFFHPETKKKKLENVKGGVFSLSNLDKKNSIFKEFMNMFSKRKQEEKQLLRSVKTVYECGRIAVRPQGRKEVRKKWV